MKAWNNLRAVMKHDNDQVGAGLGGVGCRDSHGRWAAGPGVGESTGS